MRSANQLRRIVTNSAPGDWARWETEWSTIDTGSPVNLMAVYQPDPQLRIELGRVRTDAVLGVWVDRYDSAVENKCHSVWVLYNISPIDRLDIVAVEGFKAWIPVPDRPSLEGEPWMISPYQSMIGAALSPDLYAYRSCLKTGGIEVKRRR